MKQFILKISLLLLGLTISINMSAYDCEVDGIYYNINASAHTASVTYGGVKYQGSVDIPSSFTWKSKNVDVTSIGWEAFDGCTSLTSVMIPHSVTYVSGWAFANCKSLTSVKFEDGNVSCRCYYYDYSEYSFERVPIKDLYIGKYVYDFLGWDYNSLQTLTIGSQLKSWGQTYYGDNVITVNSLITNPRQLVPSFSDKVYLNATLYVPTGTKSAYEQVDGWKEFFDIQEKDFTTGTVNTVMDEGNVTETCRYNGNGQVIDTPQQGLNIIRYSNGIREKVFIK